MARKPIPLTPTEVNVLLHCPLHYHFLQQNTPQPHGDETGFDRRVRRTLDKLHAAGGPSRLPLAKYLAPVAHYPAAKQMAEQYFHRLRHDWKQVMATNEGLSLRISIAGVPLLLHGTVDRLDQTRDGGILAILFCTETCPPPPIEQLRNNPANTIFHALVAAAYPLKRPVRIQQLWLYPDQALTVELSEEEYRANLGQLREPVRALARGEINARPGLHCDTCPFKHNGCPVYSQSEQTEADDFDSPPSDGKIQSRTWIFKE
jgi:RecB family exonuclease